jgi:hypothetical protein
MGTGIAFQTVQRTALVRTIVTATHTESELGGGTGSADKDRPADGTHRIAEM